MYSKFCGPCESIQAIMKKWKTEIAKSDIGSQVSLSYAQALNDEVGVMEKLRNKSVPMFLIYADGVLVDVVKGPNVPYLEKTIKDIARKISQQVEFQQLNVEFGIPAAKSEKPKTASPASRGIITTPPAGQEQTLMLIKPNCTKKVNEVKQILKEVGFTIGQEKKLVLSKDQAKFFYREHEGKPFFDNLVEYMTSGPILAFRVFRESGVTNLRQLLGPTNVSRAKDEAPTSLRAKYGSEGIRNGFHGSDAAESADRELKFIFDESIVKSIRKPYSASHNVPVKLEPSLVIVRPEVVGRHQYGLIKIASITNLPPSKSINFSELNSAQRSNHDLTAAMDQTDKSNLDDITYELLLTGLELMNVEQLNMSKEKVEQILGAQTEEAIHDWTDGSSVVFKVYGDNAVSAIKELIGPLSPAAAHDASPDSLCSRFGVSDAKPGFLYPETAEQAVRVCDIFFAATNQSSNSTDLVETTFAILKPDVAGSQVEADLKNRLKANGFSIVKEKSFTMSREQVEHHYEEMKGRDFFAELVAYMTSGPVTALILSRPNAIVYLREMMGPVDPQKAKNIAPGSIRADFGSSVLKNAIYGAASFIRAQKDIQYYFNDTKSGSHADVRGSLSNLASKLVSSSKSSLKNAANSLRKSAENLVGLGGKQDQPADNQAPAPAAVASPVSAEASVPVLAAASTTATEPAAPAKPASKPATPVSGSKADLAKKSTANLTKTGSKTEVTTSKSNLAKTSSKPALDKVASKPALEKAPSKTEVKASQSNLTKSVSKPAVSVSKTNLAKAPSKPAISGSKTNLEKAPSKAAVSGSKANIAKAPSKSAVSGSKSELSK